MAIIGTFTKSENGYVGAIKTLTLNLKVLINPAQKANDKAPDYRVLVEKTEVGGRGRSGRMKAAIF